MVYNLESEIDRNRLKLYLDKLTKKKVVVELKEVTARSLAQNSYLHLIIGWFGKEFGYHLEEAKMIYKYVNKDLYFYQRDSFDFMRPSSDLTKDEMTLSINKFRDYSAELDLYLPSPEDQAYLKSIYIELKNDNYL